jgi:hypothetical protein
MPLFRAALPNQHDQGYTDDTNRGGDHQQTFACARNMDCPATIAA